jgi:hypothetical protein
MNYVYLVAIGGAVAGVVGQCPEDAKAALDNFLNTEEAVTAGDYEYDGPHIVAELGKLNWVEFFVDKLGVGFVVPLIDGDYEPDDFPYYEADSDEEEEEVFSEDELIFQDFLR